MKIQDLITDNPQSKDRLLKLEKKLKVAELTVDLAKNPAMEIIIKELRESLNAINYKLLYNRDVSDIDRAKLFTERGVYIWFLDIFPDSEKTIEKINKILEKYD